MNNLAQIVYIKSAIFAQLKHARNCLFLLIIDTIILPSTASALCVIDAPVSQVRANASLIKGRNDKFELKNTPMSTNISFKCDTDTNYQLVIALQDSDPITNALILSGFGTDKILVHPKIKTVNGGVVDRNFRDMVGGSYSGRAVSGVINYVRIEFEPVQVHLQGSGARSNGYFNGRAQFLLQY